MALCKARLQARKWSSKVVAAPKLGAAKFRKAPNVSHGRNSSHALVILCRIPQTSLFEEF